jgi:hypothetical protein
MKRSPIACLLLVLMLAACKSARTPFTGLDPYPANGNYYGPVATDADKNASTPMPPSDAPPPDPGMASLSGALFSYTIGKVIPDTMFYLTPAAGENHDSMPSNLTGPQTERGDIASRSDIYGNFQLTAVPPGSYFLIVSAPYNWCPAETAPDNPAPRLIRPAAGDRLALGVIYVSWP